MFRDSGAFAGLGDEIPTNGRGLESATSLRSYGHQIGPTGDVETPTQKQVSPSKMIEATLRDGTKINIKAKGQSIVAIERAGEYIALEPPLHLAGITPALEAKLRELAGLEAVDLPAL